MTRERRPAASGRASRGTGGSAGNAGVRDVRENADDGDLGAALSDLGQVGKEAREEGYPAPSGDALANAERLLRSMYRLSPRRFEAYPTPDGEVAIDAPGGPGRSVLVLCGSDGGALCLFNDRGSHRRARHSDANELPDGFLREALDELATPAGDPA